MPGSHGAGCNCREDAPSADTSIEWLNKHIDFHSLELFGAELVSSHASSSTHTDSLKNIFRPYSERLIEKESIRNEQRDPFAVSIPFTNAVKITSISIIGGENDKFPSRFDLHANPVDPAYVDELQPTQSVDNVVHDYCGGIEYPLRVAKFSNVTNLTIRFSEEKDMEVFWIGIKGTASGAQRKAVVTVYESRPNVLDHKTRDDALGSLKNIQ